MFAAFNTLFTVGTTVAPFDPSSLSPALWLDANYAPSLFDSAVGGSLITTDGSVLKRWEDRSGNSRHITQATTGNAPLLKLAVTGSGKNAIRFDGTDDYMDMPVINGLLQNLAGFTIYGTFKFASVPTGRTRVFHASGALTSATKTVFGSSATSGKRGVGGRRVDADTFVEVVGAATILSSAFAVQSATVEFSTRNANLYLNNSLDGTTSVFGGAAGNSENITSSLVRIGASATATELFSGDLVSLLVFQSIHDSTQRANMQAYLAATL